MSDYKDFVGSILNRAKGLADSEAVSGVVERVRGAAQNTGISEVFEKGSQRARSFGNATKLTVDLSRDYKELERVFCEIGKLFYQQSASSPEGFFVPLFEQVETLRTSIAAKEAEIEAYKASFNTPDSGSTAPTEADLDTRIDDFESIVDQTETDGSST